MRIKRAVEIGVALFAVDAGVFAVRALARQLPQPAGAAGASPPAPRVSAPGATAERPSDIPMAGWKQVGKRVFTRIGDDRVMAEAAAVTYYSLLAIFPAIASLISLYGLVSDPASIGENLRALGGVVPDGGMQIIQEQIHALTSAPHKALGFGFLFGLGISLWSANAGVKSLFDALNSVYEAKETRSFLHRTWLSLAFTVGGLVFIILAFTAVLVVPAMLAYVGLGSVGHALLNFGRWPLMLGAVMLMLALVYRYGPSRGRVHWRWVTWGSGFASLLWILGSAGFSWYAANFGNYNKTYGSLGAAVGFMTWIWISMIIVLVGGELNAQLESQTEKSTRK